MSVRSFTWGFLSKRSAPKSQMAEAIGQWIVAGIALFMAIAKGLAVWLLPLAVAVYVVTYFVMVIIFVVFWTKAGDLRIRPSWQKRWGNGST